MSDVLNWTDDEVDDWLERIGYSQYAGLGSQHGLSGAELVHVSHDDLQDLGIHSIGHRLALLKAIYALKVDGNIAFDIGDWQPPEVLAARPDLANPNTNNEKIEARLRNLEQSYAQILNKLDTRNIARTNVGTLTPPRQTNGDPIARGNSPSSASPLIKSASPTPASALVVDFERFDVRDGMITLIERNKVNVFLQTSIAQNATRTRRIVPIRGSDRVFGLLQQLEPNDWRSYVATISDASASYSSKPIGDPLKLDSYLLPALSEYRRDHAAQIIPRLSIYKATKFPSPLRTRSAAKVAAQRAAAATARALLGPLPPPPTLSPNEIIGYGIGIFPNLAVGDDDLDVNINDNFIIFKSVERRTIGSSTQAFAQRDYNGSGLQDASMPMGWIETSCIIETRSVVKVNTGSMSTGQDLAQLIINSSGRELGVVRLDYTASMPGEISIKQGESVAYFKSLSGWYLIAKVGTTECGWTPSWHLGTLRSGARALEGEKTPVPSLSTPREREREGTVISFT